MGWHLPAFRNNMLPPSSGWSNVVESFWETLVNSRTKNKVVPRSKRAPLLQNSVTYWCMGKTPLFVLRSTQNDINMLCGRNVELVNVKPGGAYSNCGALNLKDINNWFEAVQSSFLQTFLLLFWSKYFMLCNHCVHHSLPIGRVIGSQCPSIK